jgi:hypothetical protein
MLSPVPGPLIRRFGSSIMTIVSDRMAAAVIAELR